MTVDNDLRARAMAAIPAYEQEVALEIAEREAREAQEEAERDAGDAVALKSLLAGRGIEAEPTSRRIDLGDGFSIRLCRHVYQEPWAELRYVCPTCQHSMSDGAHFYGLGGLGRMIQVMTAWTCSGCANKARWDESQRQQAEATPGGQILAGLRALIEQVLDERGAEC